jgi:GTP cyclohydrolase I
VAVNELDEFTAEERIQAAVRLILRELGYSTADQHFEHTPERYAKLLLEYRRNGSDETGAELLEVVFDDEHDSLVIVGPTRVVSMCAHHMLPVTGWAWVGYIPDGHVVGISKLARIVHHYARQFTVQERVTQQIAKLLMDQVKPKGVMVVIKADHGCMRMRGVEEPNALTVTSAVRGVFLGDPSAKEEFLRLIGGMQP